MGDAAVFETFGFLFTAKDLASAVIKKTSDAAEFAQDVIANSLDATVQGVETFGVSIAKGLTLAAKPFTSVFGDAVQSAMILVERGAIAFGPKITEGFMAAGEAVTEFSRATKDALTTVGAVVLKTTLTSTLKTAQAIIDLPGHVQAGFKTFKKSVTLMAEDALAGVVTKGMAAGASLVSFGRSVADTSAKVFEFVGKKQFSFVDFFDATVKGVSTATKTIREGFVPSVTALGAAAVEAGKTVLPFWNRLKDSVSGAAVAVKDGIVKNTTSWFETVQKAGPAALTGIGKLIGKIKEWDQASGKMGSHGLAGMKGMSGGKMKMPALEMEDDDPWGLNPDSKKGKKNFGKIRKGMNKVGALIGSVFTGPIGYILKLLTPLLDMLERSFEPALETIGILFENTFAPFASILDTIAQSMAPLISKFMQPLVSILELLAVQAGAFLQSFGGATGLVSPLLAIFEKLQPVAQTIFDALANVAKAVLPLIMKLVDGLAPVIAMIAESFGALFAVEIQTIADVLTDAGPPLVEAAVELAKALIPLLPVVLKLGAALLKNVFAPVLVKTIQAVAFIISKVLVPVVTFLVEHVSEFFTYITDAVVDFYGHFKEYMTKLTVAFEPEITMFSDFGSAIVDAGKYVVDVFSGILDAIKPAFNFLGSAFDKLSGWAKSALEWLGLLETEEQKQAKASAAMASNVNKGLIDAEMQRKMKAGESVADMQAMMRQPGGQAKLQAQLEAQAVPKMGDGGITTRPTVAQIGEAGSEAIIPLKPETLRSIVLPIIGDIPALAEMVAILGDIRAAVRGTLRVSGSGEGAGTERPSSPRGDQASSDLDSVVGMMGLVR